jgi:hypothetical protein
VRGNWKPVVTTEEMERGLEILAKHAEKTYRQRKHTYLLNNILFMEYPEERRLVRMTCSTSNPGRPGRRHGPRSHCPRKCEPVVQSDRPAGRSLSDAHPS